MIAVVTGASGFIGTHLIEMLLQRDFTVRCVDNQYSKHSLFENPNIEKQMENIIEIIRNSKDQICAIGEIGLDHHFVKEKALYPLQKAIFDQMLSLAQELELPVNIHTKGAEKLVFDTLPSYKIPKIT